MITLVDVKSSPDYIDKIESKNLADLFVNELNQYISPVLSMEDHSKRIRLIIQHKNIRKIPSPPSPTTSKMPQYLCNIRIGTHSVFANLIDINIDTITVARANIEMNPKKRRKAMIELADEIIQQLTEKYFHGELPNLSLIKVKNPEKFNLKFPEAETTHSKQWLLLSYGSKNRPITLKGYLQEELILLGSRKINAHSFQSLTIAKNKGKFKLRPMRHQIKTGLEVFLVDERLGYNLAAQYFFQFSAKLHLGIGVNSYQIPTSQQVSFPVETAPQTVLSSERFILPHIAGSYQLYASQLHLIYGLELGMGFTKPLYFGRLSLAWDQLPWLSLKLGYHYTELETVKKQFHALGQSSHTTKEKEAFLFPSAGLHLTLSF